MESLICKYFLPLAKTQIFKSERPFSKIAVYFVKFGIN
jgi:hypothetical protein